MLTVGEVANWASIVGLVLSVIGFVITIIGVYRSKSAAERAEEASVMTRRALGKVSALEDVVAAISEMEEIKRLHRANAWQILPDRYANLRRRLVSIRASESLSLAEPQQAVLQNAVQHFADLEERVERTLATGAPPTGVARMNTVVSRQLDDLHELMTSLKAKF